MCVGCVVNLLVIGCFRVAWNVWSHNVNIICVWLDLLCVHMCECTPPLYVQMAWCDEGVLMRVGACQYGICVAHIYDRVMCVHVCVFILLTACLVCLCVLARMRTHVCVFLLVRFLLFCVHCTCAQCICT